MCAVYNKYIKVCINLGLNNRIASGPFNSRHFVRNSSYVPINVIPLEIVPPIVAPQSVREKSHVVTNNDGLAKDGRINHNLPLPHLAKKMVAVPTPHDVSIWYMQFRRNIIPTPMKRRGITARLCKFGLDALAQAEDTHLYRGPKLCIQRQVAKSVQALAKCLGWVAVEIVSR